MRPVHLDIIAIVVRNLSIFGLAYAMKDASPVYFMALVCILILDGMDRRLK